MGWANQGTSSDYKLIERVQGFVLINHLSATHTSPSNIKPEMTREIPSRVQEQEFEQPPGPNNPLLGNEKYYNYPSTVKFHVNRRKLRRLIDDAFLHKDDGRPTIVVLEGQGGNGLASLTVDTANQV